MKKEKVTKHSTESLVNHLKIHFKDDIIPNLDLSIFINTGHKHWYLYLSIKTKLFKFMQFYSPIIKAHLFQIL
jgi:hypothetical protein